MTTIVVTGVGRSGTSMVAGTLHRLGVPVGSDWADGIFEDQPMRRALYHFFHDERAQTIATYNKHHPKWAFKFPGLHNHMFPPEMGQFRDPRLVVLWRDAFSVSQRAEAPMHAILREQTRMSEFAHACKCPVLMVSYEKAMASTAKFVTTLATFTDIKLTQEALAAALAGFGDRQAYLDAPHE
jgi:hypothetical protein